MPLDATPLGIVLLAVAIALPFVVGILLASKNTAPAKRTAPAPVALPATIAIRRACRNGWDRTVIACVYDNDGVINPRASSVWDRPADADTPCWTPVWESTRRRLLVRVIAELSHDGFTMSLDEKDRIVVRKRSDNRGYGND